MCQRKTIIRKNATFLHNFAQVSCPDFFCKSRKITVAGFRHGFFHIYCAMGFVIVTMDDLVFKFRFACTIISKALPIGHIFHCRKGSDNLERRPGRIQALGCAVYERAIFICSQIIPIAGNSIRVKVRICLHCQNTSCGRFHNHNSAFCTAQQIPCRTLDIHIQCQYHIISFGIFSFQQTRQTLEQFLMDGHQFKVISRFHTGFPYTTISRYVGSHTSSGIFTQITAIFL